MTRAKYRHRWWDGGVFRQRTFDRKGDRDAFRDELRRRRQLGGLVAVAPDMTLAEWVEEWWQLHAIPNLERQTRESYLQLWSKHLLPRMGSYRLREISPMVVGRLVIDLRRAGVGDPTSRKALAVLQSILSLAVAHGRLDSNPVAKVRKPSQAPAQQVDPLPPVTVEQLRERMGERDATLVSVLGYAGLRPQELLALHVEDLTPKRILIGRKNVDGELLPYTKTRKNRTVDLLAPVAHDLREYMMSSGRRDGLLFPTAAGAPWRRHDWNNWRKRVWQPAAASVGIGGYVDQGPRRPPRYEGADPYALRGSFVSLMVWEGRTMLEVAALAGHGVQTCETHYARVFAEYDPGKRTDAETAIRAARERLGRGEPLFDSEELRR